MSETPTTEPAKRLNLFAWGSLALGVVGIYGFMFMGAVVVAWIGVLGLIAGVVGRMKAKVLRRGRGVSFAGIVISCLLIPFFALPGIEARRTQAVELGVLRVMKTVNAAEVKYNSQFGRYAQSLTELGPSASNLVPAGIATGESMGYHFTLAGTPTGYTITAAPLDGRMSSRTFYSDQSLVIRENSGPEPATATSKAVESGNLRPF